MKKRYLLLIVILSIIIVGCSSSERINFGSEDIEVDEINLESDENRITVFKSPLCGCCTGYVKFLERKGFDVETITTEDVISVKEEHSIPKNLESCHTSIIKDYFIEGHVPIEAVRKLLEEKPDVNGIALPGMPSGSPGMAGGKIMPFIVYKVNKDGSYEEFIRI